MAEEQKQDQQDGSKTLVSFVVGLLIGGMLVWAFSGPSDSNERDRSGDDVVVANVSGDSDNSTATDTTGPTEDQSTAVALPVGDGTVVVNDQPAASIVTLSSATYPVDEGWIGVRDYNNGQLGFILGVVQFSAAAELVPEQIVLQTSTIPGKEYAVVLFESDGVRGFNAAGDAQIDEIFATFTAQ